ncbi:hypothetical protein ANCCAN_23157 [Ancylostoma caninum]|uniref:Protein kinase domain-containing protein n=1 Tax=Ancylostoma caninum TaxID=29170 RepID=A0A368FG83_ANCCA|nr:hypothetical protein ANCCAN_23157 [Ancylostoma caninum]
MYWEIRIPIAFVRIQSIRQRRIRAEKNPANEGDFLIQSRHSSSTTRQRLGKTFGNLKKLVDHYSKEPIVLQGGEELLLKKAVPKGKFQLVHSDVRLLKKIGSGAYGTVYRGQLLRENNKVIAVKRIDSEGTDDQGEWTVVRTWRVFASEITPRKTDFSDESSTF